MERVLDIGLLHRLGLAARYDVVGSAGPGSVAAAVITTVVATSGTTQTVPKASTALIGSDVSYSLTVPGWLDIVTQGGDTIEVDGSQTRIRLDNDGASVTLRYLSASTLGIV